MSFNLYLFIIFVWVVYIANDFYLNYKMKQLWPKHGIKELLMMPLYIFFFFLSVKITAFLLGVSIWAVALVSSKILLVILQTTGIFFCLFALAIFIYVLYFEKAFPSCLAIKRGEDLKGIYKYIRHPSYSVFFLITFGTALCLNDAVLFFLACVVHVSLYFNYFIEEKQLAREFSHYQKYLKKTKRFFPTFFKNKSF